MRMLVSVVAMLLVAGCARSIPDPLAAVRAFGEACARGDGARVHRMLGEDAQRELSAEALQEQLRTGGEEGQARCLALAKEPAVAEATAEIEFASGDRATLVLEEGQAKVAAAGAMPGGGATPVAALASFRASLQRWLSSAVLSPLTESSQTRSRSRVSALVEGLAHPETLFIEMAGDFARVELQAGHLVSLRRERGLWRVETFE